MSANRSSRRRRQRREERWLALSLSSLFLISFGIGIALALLFAWVVVPLEETVASPAVLRDDFRQDYIYMVAQAYAADNDWERAEARLAELNDPALADTVVTQVEDYLREGRSADAVRNLAAVAQQLGAEGGALDLFAPTPAGGESVAVAPTLTPSPVANAEQPTSTPTPAPSFTPTPAVDTPRLGVTLTPSPTIEPSFTLLTQRQICQAELDRPRIEVEVVDRNLIPIRAVEVIVNWEVDGINQEDRFITGFKANASEGYGDFTMELDTSYTVLLAEGSLPVSGLTVDPCETGTGNAGWRLRFQEN